MPPASSRKARLRALRIKLRIRTKILEILDLTLACPGAVPLGLRRRAGGLVVAVTVATAGGSPGALPGSVNPPGEHFSPTELAVWVALEPGPLPGKTLAKRLGVLNTPSFRAVLANLVQRRVLVRGEEGYGRAAGG